MRVQGRDVEREAGDEGRDREEQVQAAAARLPGQVPGEEGHERSADIGRDGAELLMDGRLLRVDAPHDRRLVRSKVASANPSEPRIRPRRTKKKPTPWTVMLFRRKTHAMTAVGEGSQ